MADQTDADHINVFYKICKISTKIFAPETKPYIILNRFENIVLKQFQRQFSNFFFKKSQIILLQKIMISQIIKYK